MVLFMSNLFANDVLTLTNQKRFNGKVLRIKKCQVIFKSENGDKYKVPTSDIETLEFGNTSDKVYKGYLKALEQDPNLCMKGRLDAENYHGKNGSHFILGVLFGPFAMIGTALANPTPQKGKDTMMLSKNKNDFDDPEYLACYKRKAKGHLIGMEAIGWGASFLFFVLIF